jgi:hypothetical protein
MLTERSRTRRGVRDLTASERQQIEKTGSDFDAANRPLCPRFRLVAGPDRHDRKSSIM